MAASAALQARCRRPSYLKKLAKAEDLIDLFPHNSYIGWSGFTGVGYPKKVPTALAEHVEKNNLQGKLKYNLFVGASSGAETENRWAKNNMIERRAPHQVGKEIAKGINNGNINFFVSWHRLQSVAFDLNCSAGQASLDVSSRSNVRLLH